MFTPLLASVWTLLPLQVSTAPLRTAPADVHWTDYDADGRLET